jgi:hypothetical protein
MVLLIVLPMQTASVPAGAARLSALVATAACCPRGPEWLVDDNHVHGSHLPTGVQARR